MSHLELSKSPQGLTLPEGQHSEGWSVPPQKEEPGAWAVFRCVFSLPRRDPVSCLSPSAVDPGLESLHGALSPAPRAPPLGCLDLWLLALHSSSPTGRPLILGMCFRLGSAVGPSRTLVLLASLSLGWGLLFLFSPSHTKDLTFITFLNSGALFTLLSGTYL